MNMKEMKDFLATLDHTYYSLVLEQDEENQSWNNVFERKPDWPKASNKTALTSARQGFDVFTMKPCLSAGLTRETIRNRPQ